MMLRIFMLMVLLWPHVGSARNDLSLVNSTTAPLAASATFTGKWESAQDHDDVVVSVKTDQDGTLYVDFSPDKTNVDSTLTYSVSAGTNEVHRLLMSKKFFRVRFTNTGSSTQTYLRLQTFRAEIGGLLSSPLNSVLQSDADAIVVRTRDAEFDIAAGRMEDVSVVNKFGRNAAVSTNDVPEDIWDGGGVYTGFPVTSGELVTVTSASTNDTAAGSGARTVRIYGLDATGLLQEETVSLLGNSLVDSVGIYTRVFRLKVLTSGGTPLNTAFNAGIISVAHKTTTANIFLKVPAGVSQSQVSVYTVPSNQTCYLRKFTIIPERTNAAFITGGLWVRETGTAPRLTHIFSVSNSAEHQDNVYGGTVLPALTDIVPRVTASSANNVAVTATMDMICVVT
jgi:hypothetical protein